MINAIFLFNTRKELIIRKEYAQKFKFHEIFDLVISNIDLNFFEFGNCTLVYKKFDELIVSFIVEREDEMYILSLINLFMSAMDKLLGNLNQKSFVYNFKDVNYALDNFILNGKVINLDPLDISTSPHILKSLIDEE